MQASFILTAFLVLIFATFAYYILHIAILRENVDHLLYNTTIGVHIWTWNRPASLERLISCLLNADYSSVPLDYCKIDLIFHLDGKFHPDVEIAILTTFQNDLRRSRQLSGKSILSNSVPEDEKSCRWQYGNVWMDYKRKHMGLPLAILDGWRHKELEIWQHDYFLLLEDDLGLSLNYMQWIIFSLKFLNQNTSIIASSLYTPRLNEMKLDRWGKDFVPWTPDKALRRFKYKSSCKNVFCMQVPCSWGSLVPSSIWHRFLDYYEKRNTTSPDLEILDTEAVNWTSSWKKYMLEWMVLGNFYYMYPNFPNQASFSTNYVELGVHSHPYGNSTANNDQPELREYWDYRYTVPLLENAPEVIPILKDCSHSSPKDWPLVDMYHMLIKK